MQQSTTKRAARELEVGDIPVGYENLPIVRVDKTTSPGVVYVWTLDTAAAQMIFQHGERVTIQEIVMDPYTGYPEGVAVCDNCGQVVHTPEQLAECIDSMLAPVRPSEDEMYDLTESLKETVLAYLNAGLDNVEDQVAQIVKDWRNER